MLVLLISLFACSGKDKDASDDSGDDTGTVDLRTPEQIWCDDNGFGLSHPWNAKGPYGTDRFGAHDWYAEGAAWLLETQRPDGSWLTANAKGGQGVWDTCFAILFLRRATRPLIDVASEDRPRR